MRALLLLLLIGCADLPDLGICGNGIVEEANGEACDDGKETETCNASCELACTTSATGDYVMVRNDGQSDLFCPDATYACGLDTICRRPSGELEAPSSPLAFDVRQVPLVADFDGDGYTDLVGTSATDIIVRFGGVQMLATAQVQAAPSSLSPLLPFSVGDRALVSVPTEGVALLESDGEQFVPALDFIAMGPATRVGVVVRDPDANLGDVLIAVDRVSPTPVIALSRPPIKVGMFLEVPEATLPPCTGGGPTAQWRTADIEVAEDRRSFVVVTSRDAMPFAWHVCRYTPNGATWSVAELDFAGPTPTTTLANLDTDACEELLVQNAIATSFGRLDAAGPTCAFTAVTPIPHDVPNIPSDLPLLASGQIIPGGPDEIVTAKGVLECTTADCAALQRRISPTSSTNGWNHAAVTDLNGDGAGDVVAARGSQQEDVDVVRGGATLNVYRADTAAPITSVLPGDFDGDRLGDVALVESAGTTDRLVVLYGTQDGTVGEARPMSAPGGKLEIHRLVSYEWLPTTRATDGIDDVLVGRTGANNTTQVGLAMGDAARIMTTPRFPPTITQPKDIGAVVSGRLGSPDVELGTIVFNPGADTVLQLYNVNANAWAPPLTITSSIRAPLGVLRGADQDTAVGLTGELLKPTLVTFSARSPAPACASTQLDAAARELRGIDLDGDGIDELAVYTGEVNARAMQAFDAGACPMAPVAAAALAGCVDVATIGPRAIAACRPVMNGPAILVRSIESPEPLRRLAGDARSLVAGDFDGDGLIDLAALVVLGTELNVQTLKQCPAHDTRRCR